MSIALISALPLIIALYSSLCVSLFSLLSFGSALFDMVINRMRVAELRKTLFPLLMLLLLLLMMLSEKERKIGKL